MATDRIDLGREYFGGMAAPSADQAGNTPRVNADGTDLDYPPTAQNAPTTPTAWDGASESVMVRGSGARVVSLPNPDKVGREVLIVDATGNAAAGNITISPDGAGTINGASDLVLSTNYASARLKASVVGATTDWVRV